MGALLQPAAFLGNGYAVHLRPVLGLLAGLGALGFLPASRSYVNIFYEILRGAEPAVAVPGARRRASLGPSAPQFGERPAERVGHAWR